MQGASCDILVLVDEPAVGAASAERYSAFRRHLAVANPSVQVLKLTANNLRLDQEGVDMVLAVVQATQSASGVSVAGTERQAWASSRGAIRSALIPQLSVEASASYLQSLHAHHPQCPAMVGIGLTAVHLLPAGEWNLHSVMQTIQLIFPTAKLSSTATQETWKVPSKHSAGSGPVRGKFFKRVIQLAKAKVMSGRQEEEGRKVYRQVVDRLIKSKVVGATGGKGDEDILQRLIRGVRSVHGVLQLPTGVPSVHDPLPAFPLRSHGHCSKAWLEGNSNFAVLRAFSPTAEAHPSGTVGLVVHGVLGKQEIALLEELFAACAQFKLLPKPVITAADVSLAERLRVQNTVKYSEQCALPGNWWFDGQVYVDIGGTRKPLRPDIDQLVELYLVDENAKVAAYNTLLAEIQN